MRSRQECRHPQGRNAKHLPGRSARFLRRQEAVRVRFLLVVHDEIVYGLRGERHSGSQAIMAKCMNEATTDRSEVWRAWLDCLGPEKHDWGVEVVEAEIWAKA